MAKFKLDLDEFHSGSHTGFGILSREGALNLCYHLNLELPELRLKRLNEDLYSDHKGMRFYFRLFGFYDENQEWDLKMVENRSYRSDGESPAAIGLFEESPEAEKNWLPNKEGFNFFLWFDGNKENVNFTLSWEKRLCSCTKIHQAKALSEKEMARINKTIKYTHGL